MKILFVNPSYKNVYDVPLKPFYPPLGLMYIASFLKSKGLNDIELIDYDMDVADESLFLKELKQKEYGIIAFTASTVAVNNVLDLIKKIKNNRLKAKIVLGGPHATVCFEEILNTGLVDYVIRGEGEEAFYFLIEYIKGNVEAEKVPNLAYKKNNLVLTTTLKYSEDINKLPLPDRRIVKNLLNYIPPTAYSGKVTSVITSRGCTAACKFCSVSSVFGRKFRTRTADEIINELVYINEQFGISEFHIMDDCFTADKKRVMEFCGKLKKLNKNFIFVFANGLRVDQVDEEILLNLKQIGVKTVMYGVETGDEKILKDLNKSMDYKKIEIAFAISKKMKFEVWGFFIIGLPGDTKQTILKTIRKAIDLNPDYAKFLVFKPTPGTVYFDEMKEKGMIFDFNYSNYGFNKTPVHNLESVSAEEIEKLKNKAYRCFYLRLFKLIEIFLKISSLTAFKIKLKYLKVLIKRFGIKL